MVFGDGFEIRVDFGESGAVHDVPGEAEGEEGLYAAGGAGDDGDCAGGRDGDGRGVTHGGAVFVVDAVLPQRVGASFSCEVL